MNTMGEDKLVEFRTVRVNMGIGYESRWATERDGERISGLYSKFQNAKRNTIMRAYDYAFFHRASVLIQSREGAYILSEGVYPQ